MTIDESIAKYKEITNTDANCPIHCMRSCDKCVQESGQLAKWLEELKFIRQWKSDVMEEFCRYDVSSFEELVTNARNNAIDDFVKEICKMIVQSENNGNYRFYAVEIKQAIADLAEQLKAGDRECTEKIKFQRE